MGELDKVRINKFLAEAGICSRRKAEELILEGRVEVNGKRIHELGLKVDKDKDRVALDGAAVEPEDKKIYIVLNKPEGVISSANDELNRKTVMDCVKEIRYRLHYAGRLDSSTSGIVFLTNDGEISRMLTLPGSRIPKKYIAKIEGFPDGKSIKKFAAGLELDGCKTSPASMKVLKRLRSLCEVEIVITEGRKRQIRRMCSEIGHPVVELKRVSIGEITLGRLKQGTYRHLNRAEREYIESLRRRLRGRK